MTDFSQVARDFVTPTSRANINAAKKKAEEILGAIHYDTTSLTHALVKAYRSGMPGPSGAAVFGQLREAIREAENAYATAIAQPEQKPAIRPVVNL